MSNKISKDIPVPNFIHSFGLTPSEKLIFSYIYDIIKHKEVDEPVYIDPLDLAAFASIDTKNRALSITRKLESLGLVVRTKFQKKYERDGKTHSAIKFSLPKQ